MLLRNLKKYAQTERLALNDGSASLSYKDLYKRSQALARHLLENYNTDKPLAIYGDKENDIIVGTFAAIYAKKTYVIIPDIYPTQRLEYIMQDCDADLVFSTSKNDYIFNGKETIYSEDVDKYVNKYSSYDDVEYDNSNNDKIALIIYTSGSTGNPKGVEITYDNLICKISRTILLTSDFIQKINDGGDIYSSVCLASYGFSISLDFIYKMGEMGVEWYSVPTLIIKDHIKLFDYLVKIQPSEFTLSPSVIKKLLENDKFDSKTLYRLKKLWIGGEPLHKDLAKEIVKRLENVDINNAYGATESCATGSSAKINEELLSDSEQIMPIGKLNEQRVILLDEDKNIIKEDGVVGDITIYGEYVAKGYRNNEELTKKQFINLKDGTRAFKTGDVGIYKNHYLYIKGRSDNQIKIGGNRIELEDVEAHLNKCSIIADCAAGIKTHNNINSLIGFVVLKEECKNMDQLSAFLTIKKEMMSTIEGYKIPEKIIIIDKIPKNLNSKIDRTRLQSLIEGHE